MLMRFISLEKPPYGFLNFKPVDNVEVKGKMSKKWAYLKPILALSFPTNQSWLVFHGLSLPLT
jgi:hypothetical protein